MVEMAEAFVNDEGYWDYRPLDNPPAYLTAVVRVNYDVDSIIDYLNEIDDPDTIAEHGQRVYTLEDIVQVAKDWAAEDLSFSSGGFYIETDNGEVVA